ncbi:MAG: hypothetical protein AB1468_02105 [Candidatus Micrarchaeota archaeon]
MDICIICQKQRKGRRVLDDVVINCLRGLKRKLGIAANNELYVCEECVPEHRKRRASFEKTLVFYGAIGVIIILAVLLFSPRLGSLLVAVFFGLFVLALSLLHYVPAIEGAQGRKETKTGRKKRKQ